MLIFTEIVFWINTVIALLICFSILLLKYFALLNFSVLNYRFTLHRNTMTSLSGVLVLPIVTLIDIAATGAVVSSVIPATSAALPRTILACYIIWGIAFPLANVILVLYFLRLTLYKVHTHLLWLNVQWPQNSNIASVFLTIGPLGRGSFAIIDLGVMSKKVLSSHLKNIQWTKAYKGGIYFPHQC